MGQQRRQRQRSRAERVSGRSVGRRPRRTHRHDRQTDAPGRPRRRSPTTDPATTRERIDDGQWTIPPGNLLVIDDADHLDPAALRYFTEHAGRSNTKLLLVHTPSEGRTPAHSLVDALADNLPWAQKLGTPDTDRNTALDRAHTHLTEHQPVTTEDRDAAELLARRDTYQTQFKPRLRTHDHSREHTRDHGLDL